ncbi:urea transporter [uncultured Muribaculum sp.]|uniref:urea transporter n=1 Tax=uncultured Muribaculum sp. TaxID=1918613 RepID=UPI002594F3D6|nr:urea transporter [uncultured Muribaculum sp.]
MNSSNLKSSITTLLNGSGQVMFQQNSWTGALFLCGIFYGACECRMPQVAWGAVIGLISATLAGIMTERKEDSGPQGLWGFNGILVGCVFPTFLSNTWGMWATLIFCSMLSTWTRTAMNRVMESRGINSLTFPFVMLTWIFLLAARTMHGFTPETLPAPELKSHFSFSLDTSIPALVTYWLKGISQVFLINSPAAGTIFLAGIAVNSRRAAIYAAAASAIALAVAIAFQADPHAIANGLFGYSPVLTGIAMGYVFTSYNLKSAIWAMTAIIATVFVQAATNMLLAPLGLPALTAPFCFTTWLFLLPGYRFFVKQQ